MDSSKYITELKSKNGASVRILRVSPNEVLICDRHCASLEESDDGSIQCGVGSVKKMVNFQTTALVIDYEVVMDRKADWNWLVCGADFVIIDENGEIHRGDTICRYMKSPKGLAEALQFVYPGSKARYRVYYETFPKDGQIVSFICKQLAGDEGRIDFISQDPQTKEFEDNGIQVDTAPQVSEDLSERVQMLENQMRRIRTEFDSLRLTLASKGVIPYKHKEKPMTDPGIEYHPLDKK